MTAGGGSAEWLWPLAAGGVVAIAAAVLLARVQRMRTVFLSYRRSDTGAEIQAVAARIAARYGTRRVFYDVRSIRAGEDYRAAIDRTLRQCDAAVILIGPEWTACRNREGELRLKEPDDVVRSEVLGALDSGALVVPLLVRRERLPEAEELPEEMRRLRALNAVRYDAALGSTLDSIAAAPIRRTPLMLLLTHGAVALFPFVFYLGAGIDSEDFFGTLAMIVPMLAATAAVTLVRQIQGNRPARVQRVRPAELVVPLVYVAGMGSLVALRAYNILSNATFQLVLLGCAAAFAAYTGVALASMFENRREP